MSKSSRSGGEIDSEGFKRLDEDEPGNYSYYYYIPPNDDKQNYPIAMVDLNYWLKKLDNTSSKPIKNKNSRKEPYFLVPIR